jgi:hypothetical protein
MAPARPILLGFPATGQVTMIVNYDDQDFYNITITFNGTNIVTIQFSKDGTYQVNLDRGEIIS